MEEITFSVITTIFNEATTITKLLDSLARQTLMPGEIVIVDAGSTDGSQRLIEQWQHDHPQITVQLLIKPGVNRSQGRNIAILEVHYDHIAVIDAGCVAHTEWLERLAYAYRTDKSIEVVAGFYVTKPENNWQQGFAPYLAIMPDRLEVQNFLPSSRSIAFTKKVWQRAGKYPEKLRTCEDLVFARQLKLKARMVVEPKALVTWRLPVTLEEYFVRVASYARGDVEAGYAPHIWKMVSIIFRYGLFYLMPVLFMAYLIYPITKHFKYLKSLKIVWILPVIQLVTDVGVLSGAVWGLWSKATTFGRR